LKEKSSQSALPAGPKQRKILFLSRVRIDNFLLFVLASVVIFASFAHLLTPIEDYDFFWHLKTGEYIWQHKALLSEDPFSYTTVHNSREPFILRGYWLTELSYYLAYLSGGFGAIILLRFLLAGLLIYFMVRQRDGDKVIYAGLLVIGMSCIMVEYPMDRPQILSFMFFAVLLNLLKSVTTSNGGHVINHSAHKQSANLSALKRLLPIPFVMLVWANMHPGVLLGQVIILLFVILEGLKFIHPSLRPVEKNAYKGLLIAGLSGIGASLLNPNTYHIAMQMYEMPDYLRSLSDYMSTIDVFREKGSYSMILYWFILLITVSGLLFNLKKLDITVLALIAGTGFFSFTQRRYIGFFLVAAIPVASRYLSGKRAIQAAKAFIVLVAIFAGIFFSWSERANMRNISSDRWLTNFYFPVKAAGFILENDLKGNMFNYYNWGGFLIWKLSPAKKVFIDGRQIYPPVFAESMLINSASEINVAGIPAWKALLEAYGVKYIIIPFYQQSGEMFPLTSALLKENKWIPVFSYGNSMIFVKDSGENAEVIRKCAIPRETFVSIEMGVY
jgi:hypothetical protein